MREREPQPKEPGPLAEAPGQAKSQPGAMGQAHTPEVIHRLQRQVGNQAVQRLLVQRSLADVDAEDLNRLWVEIRKALESHLDDGPHKSACVDLSVKVLQAMARRTIDLSSDSPSLCTNLEVFFPARLQKVMPTSTSALDHFVSALDAALDKIHEQMVAIARSEMFDTDFTVEGTADAAKVARQTLTMEQRSTADDKGLASLFSGAGEKPDPVSSAIMEASRSLYAVGQKLGGRLSSAIDKCIRATTGQLTVPRSPTTSDTGPSVPECQKLLEATLLDTLSGLELQELGDPGLELLLGSFATMPLVTVAEKLLLTPDRDRRLSGGQQAIVAGHVFGFSLSVDDVSGDMAPVISALLDLPSDAVRQQDLEPKWIKSLTVTMKGRPLDAVGGSYSGFDKHIWVGGNQKPDQVASTVRHEVGHAVDERIGWSRDKKYEASEHGGWKIYADDDAKRIMVEEVLAGTGNPIGDWPTEAKEWARATLFKLTKSPLFSYVEVESLRPRLANPKDKKAEAYVDELFGCKAFRIIDHLRLSDSWRSEVGGSQIGQRVFAKNQSYNQWMSFDLTARQTKVSDYQFYAPAEWFAELYSHYYSTMPRGASISPAAKKTIEAILKITSD